MVEATLPPRANSVHKKDAYVPYARGLARLRPGALKQGPNKNWSEHGSAAVMALAPQFTRDIGGCAAGWGGRFACHFDALPARGGA